MLVTQVKVGGLERKEGERGRGKRRGRNLFRLQNKVGNIDRDSIRVGPSRNRKQACTDHPEIFRGDP